jgi:hypothetical protein
MANPIRRPAAAARKTTARTGERVSGLNVGSFFGALAGG